MRAKLPENELQRLEALAHLQILDTEEDPVYDLMCCLAANIMETPSALIVFIDSERAWSKAMVGSSIKEGSREHSFCSHAILLPTETLVVENASLDERFLDNPYVIEDPKIRFYIGAPLVTAENESIGTICAFDSVPKFPTTAQIAGLQNLSKLIMKQLELRKVAIDLLADLRKIHSAPLDMSGLQTLNHKCDVLLDKIKARKIRKANSQ